MSFLRRYSVVIGGLLLLLVIVVLVSVPADILALQATFIGTELQYAGENETAVKTKKGFGGAEHLASFPKEFGDREGIDRSQWEPAENVGADVLLVRTYIRLGYYEVINMVVMHGDEPSSFHPPPICYRASGWEIEEEGVEVVPVSGEDWADAAEPVPIRMKWMVAGREAGAEVREREVALYFYVKGRLFEDSVTMVQVFADAPAEGAYDEVLAGLKGFMGEIVPLMFEHDEEYDRTMLAAHLAESWGGRAIIGAVLLIPLGIMIVPRARRS
jgi:hypothetical protein